MVIDTIVFEIMSLPKQRNIKQEDGYLELHDNHFIYSTKYDCEQEEEDKDMPWKFLKVDMHICVFKRAVVSLEKSYSEKTNKWQLYISVGGKQEDIWIFYETEKEVEEVFIKLYNYFFNGN